VWTSGSTTTGLVLLEAFAALFWLWAMVTALRLPSWAYHNAGKTKAVWILLLIIGLVLPPVGLLLCFWFLLATSPRVRAQARIGTRIGFPGAGV